MRALIVSVDFADLLAVTLPYNRHHWGPGRMGVCIVTHPRDEATQRVAVDNNCICFLSEAFYRDGAAFNKFAAVEEALDAFGRTGWMALVDADVLWPTSFRFDLQLGYLYSFKRRRLLRDVASSIPPEDRWRTLPLDPQFSECMGFTQIFHCSDPALGRPPWHRTDLPSAALGDSFFQDKWDLSRKVWLDADVLHLGDYALNWCGRVTPYRDGTVPEGAEERRRNNDLLKHQLWGRK